MSSSAQASSSTVPAAASSLPPVDYDALLAQRTRRMKYGDSVILSLPNGTMKVVELKEHAKSISLGKYGSFPPSALVSQLYGVTYTIQDPEATEAEEAGAQPTLVPLRGEGLAQVEDTDATNELIADDRTAQTLTMAEISAMKAAGVSAQEIIAKQIERHTAFHLKNAYSKDKYKKRKEQKFGRSLTPLAPTVNNLIKFHLARFPSAILSLREDSFSQLLSNANVRPGGRYLVVDDTGGLVLGGMIDRMGGRGRILTLSDADSPPTYHVLQNQMNFPPDLLTEVVGNLNWYTASEGWTPVEEDFSALKGDGGAEGMQVEEEGEGKDDDNDEEEQEQREGSASVPMKKGRVKTNKLGRLRKKLRAREELLRVREEFMLGEWDGLILATSYEPYSAISFLAPYLAGSGSISVYSPYLQVLTDVQAKLRAEPGYLNPIVTESWLRHYQVLPGRSHPFMNMSGTGGFLLSALKVFVGQETQSVMASRSEERQRAQARKRQKREDEQNGVERPLTGRAAKKLARAAAAAAASAGASGESTPAPEEEEGEGDVPMGGEEEELVNDLV